MSDGNTFPPLLHISLHGNEISISSGDPSEYIVYEGPTLEKATTVIFLVPWPVYFGGGNRRGVIVQANM